MSAGCWGVRTTLAAAQKLAEGSISIAQEERAWEIEEAKVDWTEIDADRWVGEVVVRRERHKRFRPCKKCDKYAVWRQEVHGG